MGASTSGARWAVAIVLIAAPFAARAQDAPALDRPRVSIAIDPSCPEIDRSVVRRVLEVELGGDADLDAAPDTAGTRVRASCADVLVTLALDESLTGKQLTRTIDVRETPPDGRSRLVALAMAELISASWIELAMRHDADVVALGARASEEQRAIALEIARARLPERAPDEVEAPRAPAIGPPPVGVRAIGVGRLSGEPVHFAGGGGLAADWEFFAPLAVLFDVRAEHGSVGIRDLGSVSMTAAWAGAMLALRLPLGLNHADFGIGGRLGAGWVTGTGERGVTGAEVVGPIAALTVATHLSLHVAQSGYLHVGVELGWIGLPVYGTLAGTDEVVARIGGAYLAITLGFEVRPQ